MTSERNSNAVEERSAEVLAARPGPISASPNKYWQASEIITLRDAVNSCSGGSNCSQWTKVASLVPGRTAKQCRQKWDSDTRPDISKEPWSDQEECLLATKHCEYNGQVHVWAKLEEHFPGRSKNNLKNHYNAAKRYTGEVQTPLRVYARNSTTIPSPALEGMPPLSSLDAAEDHIVLELEGDRGGLPAMVGIAAAPMSASSRGDHAEEEEEVDDRSAEAANVLLCLAGSTMPSMGQDSCQYSILDDEVPAVMNVKKRQLCDTYSQSLLDSSPGCQGADHDASSPHQLLPEQLPKNRSLGISLLLTAFAQLPADQQALTHNQFVSTFEAIIGLPS